MPLDSQRFAKLRTAIREQRLAVRIDPKRLAHIDCPVAADALATRALYVMIALGAAAFWLLPWAFAAGFCAAMLLFYGVLGYQLVAARMERVALVQMLNGQERWDAMWRFGGVRLTDRADGAEVTGPDDDWRQFIDAKFGPPVRPLTALSLAGNPVPG